MSLLYCIDWTIKENLISLAIQYISKLDVYTKAKICGHWPIILRPIVLQVRNKSKKKKMVVL